LPVVVALPVEAPPAVAVPAVVAALLWSRFQWRCRHGLVLAATDKSDNCKPQS
jgi:hypothetical protein